MNYFLTIFLSVVSIFLSAQNQNVGIGTTSPNASAALDIVSTDKGILIPRLTALEISAINNPIDGLMAYNKNDKHIYIFDYTLNKWRQVQYSTTTINIWQCGNDYPYGGKNYATILINGKCWMRENLNIGTMIPWGTLSLDNGDFEKYCINNNSIKCDTFGGLYHWIEAVNYDIDGNSQGLCPAGWHVATDLDFKNLEIFLGMTTAQANAVGFRGTNQGSKIAFYEPIWVNGPLDMDPAFGTGGLELLPSSFEEPGTTAGLWTATPSSDQGSAIFRLINSYNKNILRGYQNTQWPQAIRCVKN
jgi:uncharacterized protein (TIGR02145 family)